MSITSSGRNSPREKGFETELTEKQRFYLYLFSVCPSVEMIHILWKLYKNDIDNEVFNYYKEISPFMPHPCGNDCLFHPVAGFIDPDIFMEYYVPRENYLSCISMIGHPDFICQYSRKKEELEQSIHYFDALINEEKLKLTKLNKVKVLESVITYLSETKYSLTIDQIMRYLQSFYNMYKDMKILRGHSLGVDSDFELCRFE